MQCDSKILVSTEKVMPTVLSIGTIVTHGNQKKLILVLCSFLHCRPIVHASLHSRQNLSDHLPSVREAFLSEALSKIRGEALYEDVVQSVFVRMDEAVACFSATSEFNEHLTDTMEISTKLSESGDYLL